MNHRFLTKVLACIISICVIFASCPIFAVAFAPQVVVCGENEKVLCTYEIENDDATNALFSAFSYTANNAGSDNKLIINVTAGTFNVTHNIVLSNYTTINLEGVTLLNTGKNRHNIFISPNKDYIGKEYTGYSSLTDFVMNKGTLDYNSEYNNTSCLIRLAHCNNVTFNSVSFLNNKDSHHVEIAACKNVSFLSCTFDGQTSTSNSSSCEALQIDILDETAHFKNFPSYDGTMNDGITVKNCTFSNLIAGVGTRSAFLGNYQSNIVIEGNKFSNILRAAVTCTNYVSSKINSNTINNCGMGICYYMFKNSGTYCFQKSSDGTDLGSRNTSCKSEINRNIINVCKTKESEKPRGIYCYGSVYNGSEFEKGNYAVFGIKIKNNNVVSTAGAISLSDVCSSEISSNTVNHSGSFSEWTPGIFLSNNSIKNKIFSNTVKNTDSGIHINDATDANYVYKNTISNTRSNGIYAKSAKNLALTSNIISSPSGNGISVNTSKNVILKSNSVTGAANHGIYFKGESCDIRSNTLSKCKGYGILVDKGAAVQYRNNSFSSNKKGCALSVGTKSNTSFSNLLAPSSLSITKDKKRNITIKWKKSSNAQIYYVYRSDKKDGTYKKIGSAKSKIYYKDTTKKKAGKTYYYKVYAKRYVNNVSVYSPYSKIVCKKV